MKTEKQQASEFEVVHNSAISAHKTEEISQIDELESTSTQELVISVSETKDYSENAVKLESASTQDLIISTPNDDPISEISLDKTATYVAKTDRIRAISEFIKSISPYLWAIVIVVVIIPLLGRALIAIPPETRPVKPDPVVVVVDKFDWKILDESIITAIKNADVTAQNFAEAKLDDWVNGLMVNVDGSFLDWYFNYFNQKKLEFSAPFIWASSAVAHWVDSNQPSPEQVVVEKMTEDFQLEFAKRVLRPKIAQFELESITNDTVNVYVSQLEKNISSIQGKYHIPQGNWERYLNEIAITINESEGVTSNLTLKTLVGGGSYLFVKTAIPIAAKVGSKIATTFAGKAGAKMAAKTGGMVAGKIGAELLDPIVGIGILIWDLWDYNHTVSINRPILRASILEYLHQVKHSLLNNPTNGIMASINQLESGILKSVQLAKHPG
ncbi:hypothetical protein FJR41_010620 [Dolichospermum planctonicum UHCC 0167]|uniref:hypothetical protein n=1 Tax=Dolichospermum planctonicum TaxID=136072 RepID=UPI00157FC8D3|nr:hypothetical protein [Dolichospermum planctonicum]MCW9681249.1 hypothetical protein [Dolichospermum planctonicum UHCC 0167]